MLSKGIANGPGDFHFQRFNLEAGKDCLVGKGTCPQA